LLHAIAALYGRADAKYVREDLLDHLFARSPAGSALHAFALEDDRPVGHCAVVPMLGRSGDRELLCGKLEGLFLEEEHRGRRPDLRPTVLELLDRLYGFADDRGIELIHALATPAIGRLIRFVPLENVGRRTLVSSTAVVRSAWSRRAPAAMQGIAREGGYALARVAARGTLPTSVRAPTADDVDLVDSRPPPSGRWTLVAADSWEWYRTSPLLRVLEIAGPDGSRTLLQIPGTPGEPVRIVGWRPARVSLRPAVLLLGTAGRLARELGAPTLRFQPWASAAGNGPLARACRLLGFVPRRDLTTVWVRTPHAGLASPDAVVPTPLLYLGF
jgi:hypothetical protein